jgi:TIR domain
MSPRMGYEYDIFVSYRRSITQGPWVANHFVPLLEARLNDIAPKPVRVFWDGRMEDGVKFPDELKSRLRTSRLLLSVWSADYFRSTWCMAEWQSFRKREKMLGLFSAEHPQGLVYPIRYADGEYFHRDAKETQCRKDFTSLNFPDEIFKKTIKYLEFDVLVQEVANDLVIRLGAVPPWNSGFPIVEPRPMKQVNLKRVVL